MATKMSSQNERGVTEEGKFVLKKAVKWSTVSPKSSSAIFDTNGRSEEVVKKNKVVAGKKLTCLGVEILKIGHQEAKIRPCKETGNDPELNQSKMS